MNESPVLIKEGPTGIFVTGDEIVSMRNARDREFLRIRSGFYPKDTPGFNWVSGGGLEMLQQDVWRLAVKHGLPKISGFYGLNLQTGEFTAPGGAIETKEVPSLIGGD